MRRYPDHVTQRHGCIKAMIPHTRRYWAITAATCGLVLAIAASSYVLATAVIFRNGVMVAACRGGLFVVDQINPQLGPVRAGFRDDSILLLPRLQWRGGNTAQSYLFLPFWPLVSVAIGVLAVAVRQLRHRAPGMCTECGYDLQGNVSGRCPECGQAVM